MLAPKFLKTWKTLAELQSAAILHQQYSYPHYSMMRPFIDVTVLPLLQRFTPQPVPAGHHRLGQRNGVVFRRFGVVAQLQISKGQPVMCKYSG